MLAPVQEEFMRGYAFTKGQSWYDLVTSDLEGDDGNVAVKGSSATDTASKVH